MDRSLEQVEPPRNRSRRRMAPSAVVLSRSLLFRDTLCRRLAALGV
jgi:hypothetical protein